MNTQELSNVISNEETMATLLVGLLFGWSQESPCQEDICQKGGEEGPREEGGQEFGIDMEEIQGISSISTEDKETEKFFESRGLVADKFGHPIWVVEKIPTWALNNAKYFTSSGGENFEDISEGEKADAGSRWGTLNVPEKKWYSAALAYKHQTRNFHKWVSAVWKAKESGDQRKIQKYWKQFWKIYFRKSPDQRREWLFSRDISALKELFHSAGIKRKK